MSLFPTIGPFTGQYGWLSNFYHYRVVYEGKIYHSVENAYQAAKTLDKNKRKEFQKITPGQAKRKGAKLSLREDWNDVKLGIMEQLVRQKFQGAHLKKLLLETGEVEIIEFNRWGDTYWGVCDGKGENRLGNIIMKIRKELK